MEGLKDFKEINSCPVRYVLAVNDALNAISGKWKMPIIASLSKGKLRFKDMEQNIGKITPRMLSKELKDLEMNGIVNRIVHNTTPVLIEYELSESGKDLTEVLNAMIKWGLKHRKVTLEAVMS